ncbi:Hypothetical predicted protein, partial [Pelobates cultripes]
AFCSGAILWTVSVRRFRLRTAPDLCLRSSRSAWLYNAIADSTPKALAAFREQSVKTPTATISQLSDSEESHGSDWDEVPRKHPWKGDSATA